jgi:hypothetical protein
MPVEYRDQRTEREYCKTHKVSSASLARWKRTPGFWSEVQEMCKQFMADTVPETLVSLKEYARRGSFQHQKMYLEMVNLYSPKDQTPTNVNVTVKILKGDTSMDDL